MRLFVGIAIPEKIKEQLNEVFFQLKRDYPQFNWIPEENYHVTVAFLGERSESKMLHIIEAIEQSIFDVPSTFLFSLEAKMFVNNGIILNLAFARNKDLETIRLRVAELFDVERENMTKSEYVPHITLARHKLPSKQQYFLLKKKLSKMEIDIEVAVKQIHLYESITKSTNSEYEIIHTFELVE